MTPYQSRQARQRLGALPVDARQLAPEIKGLARIGVNAEELMQSQEVERIVRHQQCGGGVRVLRKRLGGGD